MKHILLFIFLPLNVYGASNFCDFVQGSRTIRTFAVPENVNFFIRGAPATGEIGFATNIGNTLLDSKTGAKTRAPGTIDPILTPDGKILSVPQSMLYDPKTQTYSKKPSNYTGMDIYQGSV